MVTLFFTLSAYWVYAQSDELIVHGQTGGLYVEHSVAAKETWYSVGRMYNVDPKGLAVYNHLTFGHALVIGEEIKVPLTTANFSQDGKKLVKESLVPVFHIVQEKEWLYRISVNHNKVPIPVLEKWNHVTGDQVHVGLHMIVGYLKVKTALSALAKGGVGVPEGGMTSAGGVGVSGARVTSAGGTGTVPGDSAMKTPAVSRVAKAVMPPAESRAKRADEERKDTADVSPPAAAKPPRVSSPAPATTVSSVSLPAPHFNGGKFKADFTEGGKSVTGQAGIFKSMSGWQDGKYYALINNVSVGTIVKITDQATGKSVYAKVLGQLPDMRESAGLTVRLSNAAAAELGEGEGRFNVGVSY
jgi:LysM repeat protein